MVTTNTKPRPEAAKRNNVGIPAETDQQLDEICMATEPKPTKGAMMAMLIKQKHAELVKSGAIKP